MAKRGIPPNIYYNPENHVMSDSALRKEQVPIRPRGPAPAWGALCRVEIADYSEPIHVTIG